jgi:hypothetical protein
MAKKERVIRDEWFVEPTGKDTAHSNGVISRELGKSPDEKTQEVRDVGGTLHNVWACTLAQAKQLWGSRDSLVISFDLWGRGRNYGPVRYKTFLLSHPPTGGR